MDREDQERLSLSNFAIHYKNVLRFGSQSTGGEAETGVKAAINHIYRKILSATGQEHRKRSFVFNLALPTRASVTSSNAENYAIVAGSSDQFSVSVDDGVTQTITLTSGTARTATQVVDDINSNTNYLAADVSSSKVRIRSNTYGINAEIDIKSVSNNAYTVLGFTAASTNGTNNIEYGLPLYVKYDIFLEDPGTGLPVSEISQTEFNKSYISKNETGTPEVYLKTGKYGVQTQPSAEGGVITVVSSSASDSSTLHVTVTGFLSGNRVSETVNLNGTSGVATTQTYDTIEHIVKTNDDGYSWTGRVTVTDSGSNTLSVIPPWVTSPSYQWIRFHPIVDSARQYNLSAMAYKPDLVDDEDWPEFDEDFHDLLDLGACARILPLFGKTTYAEQMKEDFTGRMKEYLSLVDPKPNLIQQMANVQMGTATLPRHPWISGVHRGLAKSQ